MPFIDSSGYGDAALLALRLVLGAIFLAHGSSKLKAWKPEQPGQAQGGMANVMKLLSIAEPLGAAALVVGFLAPLAAAGLSIVMLGATYMKMRVWKTGFVGKQATGWEFDLLILAACVVIVATGAGALSLDALVFRA